MREIVGRVSEAYEIVSKVTDVGNSATLFAADYSAFLRRCLSRISDGEKAETFADEIVGKNVGGEDLPVSIKLLAVADKKFGSKLRQDVIIKTENLFSLYSFAAKENGYEVADFSHLLAPLKSL